MNTEQVPSSPAAPTDPFLPPKAWWRYLPGLGKWLVGGFVLFVLFLMALPSTGHVQVKGAQTKAMAQAKQIGLALKLFADDHNGNYPCADLPAMRGAEVKTSNAAFAVLFPKYLTNESIFGNKLSVYQTRQPDNEFDREYTGHPVRTLEPVKTSTPTWRASRTLPIRAARSWQTAPMAPATIRPTPRSEAACGREKKRW